MHKKEQSVSVILPAYNESKSIGQVLKNINRRYEVIVVDDGSTDETADIARKHGAKLISYGKNMGKGYALRRGIAVSRGSILVFLDGDGQHDPEDIPKLIVPLLAGKADIVLGMRMHRGAPARGFRRLTNRLSALSVRAICGRSYNDVLSGFRAARRGVFSQLPLSKDGFETEIEFLINASFKQFRIAEVPIGTRRVSRRSKLGVRAGMGIVRYLCKELVMSRMHGKFL